MVVTIDNKERDPINFHPVSEFDEVIQNIKTILSTYVFSVPLDRGFGIQGSIVDSPLTASIQGRIQNDILNAIRKYEPRAKLLSIHITGDETGKMLISIKVDIKEGLYETR